MKSLEARIAALEQLRPAPNVIFVASYRPDGTFVPLQKGTVYGARVAVIPELCNSVEEWLKRYSGASWADFDALQRRVTARLVATLGNPASARAGS